MTNREARRDRLFDYAVDHPDGFTRTQAMRDLGFKSTGEVGDTIRDVRVAMADDTIALTCDPQGKSEEWLYKLVGTQDGLDAWMRNRHDDTMARLTTMIALESTMVNASDGRTLEGKKARYLLRHFSRIVEDMTEMEV